MANRVVVNICGDDYTLVAEESPSYIQRVGSYVDGKMRETMDAAKVGRVNAAVLTAVNIADELMKSQETAEQLRGQIKGYADEAAQAQSEVSELKREVFRLQQKLERQSRCCAGRNCWPPPVLRRPCGPPWKTARTPCTWAGAVLTPAGAPGTSLTRSSRRPWPIVASGACGSSSH